MRLLIVDDSEDARDVLAATLAAGGYEDIVQADSGAQAVSLLRAGEKGAPPTDIDLILLDIMMPEMDGIEACARIRQDVRFQDVPIIMVTSMDDMSSLAQAFVAGASDYVVKPFQKTELLVRVRNALKLKGELDRRVKREESLQAANQQLVDAQAPAFSAIDKSTGFLSRDAFEDTLRDGTMGLGWVALLQIDAYDAYRAEHGDEVARTLARRLCASVAVTRGPMGSLLCAYEDGLVAIAFPPLSGEEVRRILDTAREIIAQLKIRHRDSPARGVVTLSCGYAAIEGQLAGQALADAFNAVATATDGGGDRLVQYQEAK